MPTDLSRLEVWTQFVTSAQPVITTHVLKAESDPEKGRTMQEPDLTDEYLDFGRVLFPLGRAFVAGQTPAQPGEPARIVRVIPGNGDVLVGKHWLALGQSNVLVESVDWSDLEPLLNNLEQAAVGAPIRRFDQRSPELVLADERRRAAPAVLAGVQVAATSYQARGVVLDYTALTGSADDFTFSAGTTYLIGASGSFTILRSATFQAGCVIKYGNNGYLSLYQVTSVSFPSSGTAPVFTSKDDDLFGQIISGTTSSPTYMANPALALYHPASSTTVQNALFRWCKTAI
jgi:hypothetical protein